MQVVDVQLTAVDAASGRRADVVLVIEKDSTVGDAERALWAALGGQGPARLAGSQGQKKKQANQGPLHGEIIPVPLAPSPRLC